MLPLTRESAVTSDPAELLGRLDEWLQPYWSELRRQDQQRWAAAYLMGLLQTTERKTIERMARALILPASWVVKDVAQALQHFINRSPWDDQRVMSLLQQQLGPHLSPDGVLVMEEMTFIKQGQHSVGVQRQYSGAMARKVNCQVAIGVHHVESTAAVPLGLRLYLPNDWIAQKARLEMAGVPVAHRAAANKASIALDLIDRAIRNGIRCKGVAVVDVPQSERELKEGVQARGLSYLGLVPGDLKPILSDTQKLLVETLGLDHFEGRSWPGFHHHACLVLLARAFLLATEE